MSDPSPAPHAAATSARRLGSAPAADLLDPAEHAAVISLRRALAALDPQHALELLLDKTRQPNAQFLSQIQASR